MVDVKIPSNYRVVSLKGVFKDLGWVCNCRPVYGMYPIVSCLGVENDTTYVEIILMGRVKAFRRHIERGNAKTFMVENCSFCRVKVTVVVWEVFLEENCCVIYSTV